MQSKKRKKHTPATLFDMPPAGSDNVKEQQEPYPLPPGFPTMPVPDLETDRDAQLDVAATTLLLWLRDTGLEHRALAQRIFTIRHDLVLATGTPYKTQWSAYKTARCQALTIAHELLAS